MYCHRREFCTDGYEIHVLQGDGDRALSRVTRNGVVVSIGSYSGCWDYLDARGARSTHVYEDDVHLPPTGWASVTS